MSVIAPTVTIDNCPQDRSSCRCLCITATLSQSTRVDTTEPRVFTIFHDSANIHMKVQLDATALPKKQAPVRGLFLWRLCPEHNLIITLLSNRSYVEHMAQQVAFIRMLRSAEEGVGAW